MRHRWTRFASCALLDRVPGVDAACNRLYHSIPTIEMRSQSVCERQDGFVVPATDMKMRWRAEGRNESTTHTQAVAGPRITS